MEPKVILVDSRDKAIGVGSLLETHSGRGKKHRAFVTLLVNSKNQVLLQKRKHRLFDGFWDLTAISHPHVVGKNEESYQEASDRALKKEMGIKHVEVKNIGAFNYFAKDGDNCENEYCSVLVGKYDGTFKANPKEVYETKQIDFDDFIKDVSENKIKYAPWAVLAVDKLKSLPKEKFVPSLKDFIGEFEKYRHEFFLQKKKQFKNRKGLLQFYGDLEEFTNGGKKLRAFLVYLGYLLAKDLEPKRVPKEILPICLSVEILHSFFLIHDDVMDRSDTRRGMPTIHKKYSKGHDDHFGTSMAITLGDIASFESLDLVLSSKVDASLKLKIADLITKTSLNTGYGQALDVLGSKIRLLEKEIMGIIDYKTVDYSVVMPLTVGGILGGATKPKFDAISEFGLYAGRAFQIQDDILGVFGDEKELGKSVISDMHEGKNTILIFKTRELASSSQRQILGRLWGNGAASVKDLETVRTIIKETGALAGCEAEKEKLANRAKVTAVRLSTNKSLVQVFEEIAEFLARRKS